MRHLALLCVLAACPGPGRTTSTSAPGANGGKRGPGDRQGRLVVLVVVDELAEWSFEKKRAALTAGFGTPLALGEWRSVRLPALVTSPTAGYAVLGTGVPPVQSGIVSDEWWDRDQRGIVKAAEVHARAATLGDGVIAQGGKAVGVGFDAVPVRQIVGEHGQVLVIGDRNIFGKPLVSDLRPWTPLYAKALPTLSGVDDARPSEVGAYGLGATFPHDPSTTPAPLQAMRATSDADGLVLERALHEVSRQRLGRGSTTDLLVISLPTYAVIAHAWGDDSWEAWDHMMRLDEMLARLWAGLDLIRSGRVALVITSDRGAAKPPARGHYTIEQLRLAANNAASLELGGGDWIAWIQPPTIALTPAALARPKGDLKKAMRKVIYALQAFPELDVVDRADAYEGRCDARSGNEKALCLALDPARSGDFVFTPKPGWIIDSEAAPHVPTIGSLDDSERLVPALLRGFTKTSDGKWPPMMTSPSGEIPASELASIVRTWLSE